MNIPTTKTNIFTVQSASTVCTHNISCRKTRKKHGIHQLKEIRKNMRMNKKKLMKCKRWSEKIDGVAKVSCADGFYGILALLILTSSAISATLIPVNNILMNPDYWYEIIFSSSSTAFFYACCSTIGAEALLSPFKKKIFKVILIQFLILMAVNTFRFCAIHLLWSYVLGYFEPFPHRWRFILCSFLEQ